MANTNQMRLKFQSAAWIIGLSIGTYAQSHAATTDLSSSPLASTSTSVVRPNVLFTLDDSGSMDWDYLPDYAGGRTYSGGTAKHCKVSNTCGRGETPYHANEYNGMAYNPRLTYQLPVNADGTLKASQGSPWTAVKVDGYGVQSTSTINMVSGYPEVLWCNSSICKKNGVDTNNPFSLRASVSADNPPLYAFPGTLTTGGTATNLINGTLNQATTTTSTILDGTLYVPTGPTTTVLTMTVTSLTHSGDTVTVKYSDSSPATPAIANGDTVTVTRPGGGNCSRSWRESGEVISNVTAGPPKSFTYVGNSGNDDSWSNTSECIVKVTHTAAASATLPSISKSGYTVTVTLASAPATPLASGSLVTVADGPSGCTARAKVSATPITVLSSTSFSYTHPNNNSITSDTSCNITIGTTTAPASPWISASGTTVTVYKTAHGLSTGDQVQVADATSPAGTCDSGYKTSGSVTVTRVDANKFTYTSMGGATASSQCKIDKMTSGSTTSYTSASTVNSNPYYFVIIPTEYCDSIYLTNCKAATAPVTVAGVAYSYPAPLRFCKDDTTAALPPGDAGAQKSVSGTINCQAKYSVGTGISFQSVRYGLFYRGDIVPATTTYGNVLYSGTVDASGVPLTFSNTLIIDRSGRSDCAAAPDCTYAEEMTNFSNWYAYYHTRMQMMKSSAGRAFQSLDDRYRVGFVTINESSSKYLPVAKFDATQKTNWYTKFYAVNPSGSTPLREAMANAGRYFAGKQPGVLTGDPMEYACQQNFELITTDGYWNGTSDSVKELNGTTTMGNHDNVNSGTSTRGDGAFDGGIAGAYNTLADVAMYYYKTDLRTSALGNCTGASVGGAPGVDVCENIVPMSTKDTLAGLAGTQHMTTFSLGLVDGLMTYQPDYETATTGDFSKIKTGASGCAFSGSGTCNWPLPAADSQTALDDLWHAAVNGRGTYYNARDPASLATGLSSALAGINVRLAAAAASATSSPNITQTDRSIFSSTYRTTKWDGEVTAQLIDPATGSVEPTIIWSAQAQLDTMVHSTSTATIPSRLIYTFDDANTQGDHLKSFQYASLTTSERAYFDNKCSYLILTQCSGSMSAGNIAIGNDGLNMVNYLRGDQTHETSVFRAREHFLGDTVNAKPAYVKAPLSDFGDAGYSEFKTAKNTRQGTLYMGANDGMLHAFNSDTGAEMWAYVPKIVMPELYKLAESAYATNHRYYVDGSPEIMDIYVAAPTNGVPAGWRTILVGGLGLGGRGFYALDVTDPANPIALWEICSDSTLCAIADADMGYSYGNAVITKRSTDGKWVVLLTSGYNNVSPGSGAGTLFVLDAVTGEVLSKTTTGAATNPPSGLAKISPLANSLLTDFTSRFVYGGDLNGDVWRFDLGAVGATGAPTVTKIASLKDGSGVAQSVTTRPELGDPLSNVSAIAGTGNPVVFVNTGRYLGTSDKSNTQIQTVYAIKDNLAATSYIGNPRTLGSFVQQTISQPSATTRTTSQNAVEWSSNLGWYVDLVVDSPQGERVNLDPQLIAGTLIVVTNIPESSACTIGGTSWLYSFDFKSGQYIPTATSQVVAQKIGNAITVGIVIGKLPGGASKAWVTTAGGDKLVVDPVIRGSGATRRTSWRELIR